MLALLALVQLLGMSLWFVASALAPELGARWRLDAAQVGWLTVAVQLGFVVGTALAAALNLADVIPGRAYLAACATLAALANASLLLAPGFGEALLTRFMTGCFLAGVYPPGMKMTATWFRDGRGLAIGVVVGALATGKSLPYAVHAFGGPGLRAVVIATSGAALLAATLVALFYRDGPHAFPRRPFRWSLVGEVVRNRDTRLAIAGYLGHMWELYAMWAWLAAFVAASELARGIADPVIARRTGDLVTLGAFVAGGLGCLWGGRAAARIGYAAVVSRAMAASGLCALAIGLAFGRTPWLLGPLALAWGFFVVADSAQFSALVTETAPAHAVGTALTLQTSLGFLLTFATLSLVPRLAGQWGWGAAFPVLALGPALGIAAIARLHPRGAAR